MPQIQIIVQSGIAPDKKAVFIKLPKENTAEIEAIQAELNSTFKANFRAEIDPDDPLLVRINCAQFLHRSITAYEDIIHRALKKQEYNIKFKTTSATVTTAAKATAETTFKTQILADGAQITIDFPKWMKPNQISSIVSEFLEAKFIKEFSPQEKYQIFSSKTQQPHVVTIDLQKSIPQDKQQILISQIENEIERLNKTFAYQPPRLTKRT